MSTNLQRMPLVFGAGLLVLAASGCSSSSYDGPQRAEVSGTVTYNGAPVQQGSITLKPMGSGRSASASIIDGKYLIEEPQGPELGKHRVEIFVFEPPPGASAEDIDAGMVQVAPAEFNTESTIELDVDSTEVQKDFSI